MFNDVLIIRNFKFVFFISLRDSMGQTDVTHMIKKQLIDTMYAEKTEEKRDLVYILLLQIIETEMCLVVRDGLDEWVAPDGSNLAEPSMAGFPSDKCTVLTTSRPWKLADERIKNSQIDILLEIEGLNNPYKFTERIMRCILDERKDLETISREFENFIGEHELSALSYSPMLFTLVICTWVDKIEKEYLKGSSLCALWTTLLESLCKKANHTTGFFNDLDQAGVKCFSRTNYLRPSIRNVDAISKAAFHLLFSLEKETSIVFNEHILSNYVSESEKEFALKAGLISKRKTQMVSNASFSFFHKSMQEFLAAYHIARNVHLIDADISLYLTHHNDAYLDISQVFIFLCGLNISAANKLSGMMDKHNATMMDGLDNALMCLYKTYTFQDIISKGYREAVSNEQTGILLRLSHFKITDNNIRDVYNIWGENTSKAHNIRDIYNIWTANTSNALTFDAHVYLETDPDSRSSPAHSEPSTHVEFDLSSCHKLKWLTLRGSGIHLKESASLVSSAFPVWIVLNSADPAQRAYPLPALSCIEHIVLGTVTCSSTWLRSLFSTLLTLDNEVICNLDSCKITSCVEDAVRRSDTDTQATITTGLNKTFNMRDMKDCPGLWKALHGLNIKSMSLSDRFGSLTVHHLKSLSQALASLTHLETLSINTYYGSPGLWKTFHGLNIKSLSINGEFGHAIVSHAGSLSSFTHLETLSIDVQGHNPDLWKGLHGLNIKSLTLEGLDVGNAKLFAQSLSSLKTLETLSIYVETSINIQLPQSLKYLNIVFLTLSPSELCELVDTLCACTHIVGSKLEFGCASFDGFVCKPVPPEEYIALQQKLATSKNVAVKGFRILDRIRKTDICEYDAASIWSVRDIGGVKDDNTNDDNVKDHASEYFFTKLIDEIINRISMRYRITPACNS